MRAQNQHTIGKENIELSQLSLEIRLCMVEMGLW